MISFTPGYMHWIRLIANCGHLQSGPGRRRLELNRQRLIKQFRISSTVNLQLHPVSIHLLQRYLCCTPLCQILECISQTGYPYLVSAFTQQLHSGAEVILTCRQTIANGMIVNFRPTMTFYRIEQVTFQSGNPLAIDVIHS